MLVTLQHLWFPYLLAGLGMGVALWVSALTTRGVRDWAIARGVVPKVKERDVHRTPIPRLGGVGIGVGFFAGVGTLGFINWLLPQYQFFLSLPSGGILLGAFLLLLVGIWDDVRGISAVHKLVLQILIAVAVSLAGFTFDFSSYLLFITGSDWNWVDLPLTVFWIVSIINALNLIDGLDGLAGGVAVIVVVSLTIAIALNGYGPDLVFLASFLGALCGFLIFNRHPASIFMGDSGSLFLGFLLATFALPLTENTKLQAAFFVPVLALGLPVLDTVWSIVRRLLKGRNPFAADGDHLHHRLLRRGLSHAKAVRWLYGVAAIFGVFAIALASFSRIESMLLAFGLVIVFVWAVLWRLGYFRRTRAD